MPSASSIDLQFGELAVGIIAATLVLLELVILRRQARLDEHAFVEELRRRWMAEHDSWKVLLALAGQMYVPITDRMVERDASLLVLKQFRDERDDDFTRRRDDSPPQPATAYEHIRTVSETMAFASALVLRGRIRPEMIYDIFGPSIPRNGGSLRRLLNEDLDRAGAFYSYYPGVAERVRILVDLLWVEAIRAGDLAWDAVERSLQAKRGEGTQRAVRARCRHRASRLGGWRTAIQLDWYLTRAEVDLDRAWPVRFSMRIWRWISGLAGRTSSV